MLSENTGGGHWTEWPRSWERGVRQPDLLSLMNYAQLVDVSTDVLINDDLDLVLKNIDV